MLPVHLKIVGFLLIFLGLAHAGFGRHFKWKEECGRLSPFNRQMFRVHCFFIALTLVLLGTCSLVYTKALLEPTSLSRVFLTGVVIYWLCRLFIQFFVYDSALWRGQKFNTAMHVLFSIFWLYVVATYSAALHYVWNLKG
jgi:hypothetical protein